MHGDWSDFYKGGHGDFYEDGHGDFYEGGHGNVQPKLQQDNIAPTKVHASLSRLHTRRRLQGRKVHNFSPMLNNLLGSEDAYEGGDSSDGGDLDNPHNVKHRYCNLIWSRSNFTFSLESKIFVGAMGPTNDYCTMPSFMQLFSLFWPYILLRKIVIESNQYATTPDVNGKTKGGIGWVYLST